MEAGGTTRPNHGTGKEVSGEEVSRIIHELLEAWNAHDIERIKTFYAPEYEGVDVGQAEPHRGPQSVPENVERYLRAFPDLRFVEEDIVVQDGRVVLVWKAYGTHRGRLMNIPPTGRNIVVRGTSVLTVEDGKVVRGLYIWDVAGLLRSIGLLPDL
jgi:steroid delta-isomerase-like uncharacterized protein